MGAQNPAEALDLSLIKAAMPGSSKPSGQANRGEETPLFPIPDSVFVDAKLLGYLPNGEGGPSRGVRNGGSPGEEAREGGRNLYVRRQSEGNSHLFPSIPPTEHHSHPYSG